MTLEDYDHQIKSHLVFIEAGSQMAARHARALIAKPNFETLAENDLAEARRILGNALEQIVAAQKTYKNKKLESQT
jgi:hypothetical protein